MFRINTNTSAISARRNLGITTEQQKSTLEKLSSGSRINKAADDAAGLAISEKFRAVIRGSRQAKRNANDGISLIQTAEGGLNEISNILVRLRELGVQSASDTVGNTERGFSNIEFQNLKQEIERIAQATEFNGTRLLNGTGQTYEIQVGVSNVPEEDRITFKADATNATLGNLQIDGLTIESKEGSQESLAALDTAIEMVSGQRANLGAVQNRLTSTSTNLDIYTENLSAANSRIRDADIAEISAEKAKQDILTQSGTAVLAQANMKGVNALKLIG